MAGIAVAGACKPTPGDPEPPEPEGPPSTPESPEGVPSDDPPLDDEQLAAALRDPQGLSAEQREALGVTLLQTHDLLPACDEPESAEEDVTASSVHLLELSTEPSITVIDLRSVCASGDSDVGLLVLRRGSTEPVATDVLAYVQPADDPVFRLDPSRGHVFHEVGAAYGEDMDLSWLEVLTVSGQRFRTVESVPFRQSTLIPDDETPEQFDVRARLRLSSRGFEIHYAVTWDDDPSTLGTHHQEYAVASYAWNDVEERYDHPQHRGQFDEVWLEGVFTPPDQGLPSAAE